MLPSRFVLRVCASRREIPAQIGEPALVPPSLTKQYFAPQPFPPCFTMSLVVTIHTPGSSPFAIMETSGTPRIVRSLGLENPGGTRPSCQVGLGKTTLIPPVLAPLIGGRGTGSVGVAHMFQTYSSPGLIGEVIRPFASSVGLN